MANIVNCPACGEKLTLERSEVRCTTDMRTYSVFKCADPKCNAMLGFVKEAEKGNEK